jgi:hypothetical protein
MASAQGLVSYNPKSDLDEVEKQIQAKDQEIAEAVAAQKAAKEVVGNLESKAKAALDKARALRDQEAQLRQSGRDKTETQREAILKEAMGIRRKGDDADKEAAMFKADAAKAQPDIDAADRRLTNLREERTLLDKSKEVINRVVQVNADAAGKARADADKIVAELKTSLGQLKELRAQINDPSESAVNLYSQAAGEAQKSNAARRGGAGSLAQASYEQARGDVLLAQARGLQAYASLLQTLAGSNPPAPVPGLTEDAAAAQKSFDESLAKAKEAYTKAKGLYEGAGGGDGAVPGRLKYIASVLNKIAGGNVEGTEPVAPDKGGDAAAPAPDKNAPTAVSADPEQEIREMLRTIAADTKAWNYDSLKAAILTKTDFEKKSMDTIIGLIQQQHALDEACKAKFGKDFAAVVTENAGGDPMVAGLGNDMFLNAMKKGFNFDPNVKINVKSETEAELIMPDEPKPATVVKKDGRWRIVADSPEMSGESEKNFAQFMAAFEASRDMMKAVTENLNAGKYADEKAMVADLSERMKAMQEKMKGLMGGPK